MSKNSLFLGVLLAAVAIMVGLYIVFLILPAPVPSSVWQYFTPLDVERARRYQQIMRWTSLTSYLLKTGLLLWLWWGGWANALSSAVWRWTGHRYYPSLGLFFVFVWLVLQVLELPFSFYSSFVVQQQWGFSTQSLASWWVDYLKGAGIDLFLSAAGTFILFWSTGRWPFAWWAVAGLFLAIWMVVETFLWPVVLAPLFNRFEPLAEGPLKYKVLELAEKAGLKVEEVYVMDASRRTTKANAYFAGLGKTKRIVLYDTLLGRYSEEEVEAVVAHEIAHWKKGHIGKGLIWGIVWGFVSLALLYGFLRFTLPRHAATWRPYPPQALVLVLVFLQLLTFLAQPLQNSLSRRMETEADRVALMLTGNRYAMVRLQVDLAKGNLEEVAPHPFIEWLTYSHPAPWRRIQEALEAKL